MDELGCDYDTEAVGLFVWGQIPDNTESAEQLSEIYLHKARVFITPGHIFGSEGKRYLRISLCADIHLLREAQRRIIQVLNPTAI